MATTAPAPPAPEQQPVAHNTAQFRATHGDPDTWDTHDIEDYLDLPAAA